MSVTRAEAPEMSSYAVGDYLVRRFTIGSRSPMTVSERVVSVREASIVLEVTRETAAETRSLRVELSDAPANRGEVLGASVLRDGAEIPADKSAYETIMAGTVFAADENEGEIETGSIKLDVHGSALDCRETRFRVKVHGRTATMRTIELLNSPWGEVGADITTAKGSVLYRAEVVDVGHDESRTAAVQADEGSR
jgi:hypothetical protein